MLQVNSGGLGKTHDLIDAQQQQREYSKTSVTRGRDKGRQSATIRLPNWVRLDAGEKKKE